MSARGRLRRSVLALAAGTALVLTSGAVPSSASLNSGVPLVIRARQCTASPFTWAGANTTAKYASTNWPRGTVTHCVWKYQMTDTDPRLDFYMIYAESNFTRTGGQGNLKAPAYQYLYSNRTVTGSNFDGTGSYTSKTSCTSSVQVQVSVGLVAAAVMPRLCSGYTVSRTAFSGSGGTWYTATAGEAPSMQAVYYQVVPAGTVPIYTVDLYRPTYTHTWVDIPGWWQETAGSAKWTAIL